MTAIALNWRCDALPFATHDARAYSFMTLARVAHSLDTNADEALVVMQECQTCAAFVPHGARLPIRLLSMPPVLDHCAA